MENNNKEYLCFIKYIGKDLENMNIYDFLFTDTIEEFWIDGAENVPVCLQKDFEPTEDTYCNTIRVRTSLTLKLGQENCCLSYQDIIDKIMSICYEDISEYSEYPEDGRLVLYFGEEYDGVISQLTAKNCIMNIDN